MTSTLNPNVAQRFQMATHIAMTYKREVIIEELRHRGDDEPTDGHNSLSLAARLVDLAVYQRRSSEGQP